MVGALSKRPVDFEGGTFYYTEDGRRTDPMSAQKSVYRSLIALADNMPSLVHHKVKEKWGRIAAAARRMMKRSSSMGPQ